MKTRFIIISFLTIFCFELNAQNKSVDSTYNKNFAKQIEHSSNGQIKIFQSSKIDKLLSEDYKKCSKQKSYQGYRIQIYSGSSADKNKAIACENMFKQKYQKTLTYLEYKAPIFRIRVGNFRTKLEAECFKKIIKKHYPNSYIVNQKIKFTPIGLPDYQENSNDDTEE